MLSTIYDVERDDGLEELLLASRPLVIASQVRTAAPFVVSRKALALAGHSVASVTDDDLHYLESIRVSVGWNKNDDVFDPTELWLARKTPTDKPINYEHDCKDIIGHTVASKAVDENGKAIAEDTSPDKLPSRFHLHDSDVLYKIWEDQERQKRMDEILADIAKGRWFVSMECLFRGFDYALVAADGRSKVVARNDNTAFLTKHLRVYGGTGEYGEYKVGRVLRSILFSGKGLVRNPANPESVVLTPQTSPAQEHVRAAISAWYSGDQTPSEEHVFRSQVEKDIFNHFAQGRRR